MRRVISAAFSAEGVSQSDIAGLYRGTRRFHIPGPATLPPMTTTEQITAAIEAMESQQWQPAIAILIRLLSHVGQDGPHTEAPVRLLLAQALHGSGEPERGLEQARAALSVAEQTDDRGLIWKCMAIITSMEIIDEGRL
jgi:hypothetical protein